MGVGRKARTTGDVEERNYVYPDEYKYRTGYCELNSYSGYNVVNAIRDELSDAEKALFRDTKIGHLLDIPDDQKMSGPIFSFLMTRRIHVPEGDEMWFKVGGKEICFRKQHFAAISGLRVTQLDTPYVPPPERNTFMEKHFSVENKVSGSELYDFLFCDTIADDLNDEEMKKVEDRKNRIKRKKKSVKVGTKERMKLNAVDRVRLALVYVVHRFIYGHQDITGIAAITWHLVEDFVKFNNYPWGHVGYKQTFEKTHAAFVYQMGQYDKAAVKPTNLPSIHPQGMPCVLVVWAVQVFPKLFAMCGREKKANGWLPYIFTVFCTESLNFVKVKEALEPDNSEVDVVEDILWPEPVFERLLIPGLVEGPLSDKVVVEDVSPIVQQPNASQGNVHMYDTIKEGNGTNEIASGAAFNPHPDADIWKVRFDQLFSVVVDINSKVTQLSGQVVHLNNACTAIKEELSFIKSGTFRPPFMGNCNGDGVSDGASWNSNNIVKEVGTKVGKDVGGTLYENPIIDVGEEAVENDEAETQRNHILGHADAYANDDAYAHNDDELLNTSLPYNTPTKKYEEADNDLKRPREKKRNNDEAEASGCANENSLPKVGRIRKDSKKCHTPYTAYFWKPGRGVQKKVGSAEDDVVLIKKKGFKKADCSKIDLEISPGSENKSKKHKFITEIKTPDKPAVKIDYFEYFRTDDQITPKDVQDVNDYIHQGVDDKADDPFARCDEFKKLLDLNGWLSDFISFTGSADPHINGMLHLMRKSNICPQGKWTTIDTLFVTALTKGDNFRIANNYVDGVLPECSKPWEDVDVVYGVVNIPLRKHWVAICIKVKDSKIIIYDSLRPPSTTQSDRVDDEIRLICAYLDKRYGGALWSAKYEEKPLPPQQDDCVSCGVYSLKFVEYLIKEIPLSRIKKETLLRYRRQFAIQLFKRDSVQLSCD